MKTVTVSMHFGDGSSKPIEVEIEDDEGKVEAEEQARTWVADNAWFEADPDQEGI